MDCSSSSSGEESRRRHRRHKHKHRKEHAHHKSKPLRKHRRKHTRKHKRRREDVSSSDDISDEEDTVVVARAAKPKPTPKPTPKPRTKKRLRAEAAVAPSPREVKRVRKEEKEKEVEAEAARPPAAVPANRITVRPYQEARALLLHELSLLSVARVVWVMKHGERRDMHSGVLICDSFYGYAKPLPSLRNGERTTLVGDNKRCTGNIFFNNRTRRQQALAIGPATLLGLNQAEVGDCGSSAVAAIPQAGRRGGSNASHDIIFGMKQAQTGHANCSHKMLRWQSNGHLLCTFLRVLWGGQKTLITAHLRSSLRQHAGCRDGLFALYWLVVVGDVEFFVRQFLQQGTPRMPPFDLGDEKNPLTFAIQAARSFSCPRMEEDIVAAATAAGVAEEDYMPDRVVTVFSLEEHPTWEPMGRFASNPCRQARPAHRLAEEYIASVDLLTEQAVLNAGIKHRLQAYATRQGGEVHGTSGAGGSGPPPPPTFASGALPQYSGGGGAGTYDPGQAMAAVAAYDPCEVGYDPDNPTGFSGGAPAPPITYDGQESFAPPAPPPPAPPGFEHVQPRVRQEVDNDADLAELLRHSSTLEAAATAQRPCVDSPEPVLSPAFMPHTPRGIPEE